MRRRPRCSSLLSWAWLLLALIPARPVTAQDYVQDARAHVPLPAMLGRGDAGVALPTRESAFFVNPAHIAATTGGFHFTLAGAQLGLSSNVREAVEVARDGTPDTRDNEEFVRLARVPAEARLTLFGPSVSFRRGNVGIGLGGFGQSTGRMQAVTVGAEDIISSFAQADLMGVATGSVLFPSLGLSVGAAGKVVRRYVTVYDVAVDTFDFETAEPPFVEGGTVTLDLGAQWATPIDGLSAALAVYDVLGGAMRYKASDFNGVLGIGDGDSENSVGGGPESAESMQVRAALQGRDGTPSFRAGLAYRPTLPDGFPALVLLADYVSTSTTFYVQPRTKHLRVGVETALGRLALRGGLAQGHPSAGATLNLGVTKIDYAFFVQETGRVPGQDGGTRHALLLRLGRD